MFGPEDFSMGEKYQISVNRGASTPIFQVVGVVEFIGQNLVCVASKEPIYELGGRDHTKLHPYIQYVQMVSVIPVISYKYKELK